jgi:hypothetical protein
MESEKEEIKQGREANQPKKKEMKHLSKLMDAPTKRTEQFNVLLSKVEKSMVEEMAEFYELTPANFMRSAIPALYKLMEAERAARKEKAQAMELNLKIDEQ